jgi:hypothetical protein
MKDDKSGLIRLTRREALHLGLGTVLSSAVAATGTRAADVGTLGICGLAERSRQFGRRSPIPPFDGPCGP